VVRLFRSEKPSSVRQTEQANNRDAGSLSNLLDAINKEFPMPGQRLILNAAEYAQSINCSVLNSELTLNKLLLVIPSSAFTLSAGQWEGHPFHCWFCKKKGIQYPFCNS